MKEVRFRAVGQASSLSIPTDWVNSHPVQLDCHPSETVWIVGEDSAGNELWRQQVEARVAMADGQVMKLEFVSV